MHPSDGVVFSSPLASSLDIHLWQIEIKLEANQEFSSR